MPSIKDPSEEELEDLRIRGEELVKKVNSAPNYQPVVIEFSGSPKSGKSTTIDILNHFFKRIGLKVDAPTEGVSKRTPYNLKRDLMAYNSWALCYAISSLLVGFYNVDKHHIVMLDRGPFDSLAWMRLLRKKGELSEEDYSKIRDFVNLGKWGKLVDRIYLFTCSPEISLKREMESKLILRPGTAMNKSTLSSLKEQYDDLKKEIIYSESDLYYVETSETTTPIRTCYELANDIIPIIESHIKGGSGNI